MKQFDRRTFTCGLAVSGIASIALPAAAHAAAAEPAIKKAKDLKPGQFTWHPERSPAGRIAIVVSIPDQRVHVYRNGIRIGVSTCSTGKPGHETPTGVFLILEKDKNHKSSTYNNAPMPNMNRLTWSGIALHAGNLPGYPASHGCIRLPMKFSELLFQVTQPGTPVILAGKHTDPTEIVHPGLILGNYAANEFSHVKNGMKKEKLPWQPEASSGDASTAIVVSHADMTISVLENGTLVSTGKAIIAEPDKPLGRHVFMLTGAHDGKKGMAWQAIGHHDSAGVTPRVPSEAIVKRIRAEQAMLNVIQDRMHPGMLLITTELPASPESRSGDDFVLMNTEGV